MEAPLPVPLIVSDLEEKFSTPSRSRAQPQSVQAPAAYSGVLDGRPATHTSSRWKPGLGARVVFDVDGMKLGYLEDPVVAVYTPGGELLAFDDDRLQGKRQASAEPRSLPGVHL